MFVSLLLFFYCCIFTVTVVSVLLLSLLLCRFFPTVLQPLVSVLFDAVYACLVALRCCRQPVKKYDVGAPSSITISLPGVDAHDAERRRYAV